MTFKDLKATLNTNKKVYIEDDNFNTMYDGRLERAPKIYDLLEVDEINVNENDITIVVIRQQEGDMKALDLREFLQLNGGVTLQLNGEIFSPIQGYQVSTKDCYKVLYDYVTDFELTSMCINTMREALKNECNFIGLWLDGDYLYIDVSDVYFDKATALIEAQKLNQKAIFDWQTKESIYLEEGK